MGRLVAPEASLLGRQMPSNATFSKSSRGSPLCVWVLFLQGHTGLLVQAAHLSSFILVIPLKTVLNHVLRPRESGRQRVNFWGGHSLDCNSQKAFECGHVLPPPLTCPVQRDLPMDT